MVKEKRKEIHVYMNSSNLVLEGDISARDRESLGVPLILDLSLNVYRAKPLYFYSLKRNLEKRGYIFKTSFNTRFKLESKCKLAFTLREYQMEAYEKWRKNNFKGVIISPVASGKTFIALKGVYDLRVKTLILVPTIDLLYQWRDRIKKYLMMDEREIGIFGGGRKEIKDVTVMTYASASLYCERIVDVYGLIIADECHHAASIEYRKTLETLISPYRMGLTATPLRSDGLHVDLPELLGPCIETTNTKELVEKGYIADYEEEQVYVELNENEEREYRRLMKKYWDYVRVNIPSIRNPVEAFNRVLEKASFDRKAREALKARLKAKQIALNAERKIFVLEKLLEKFRGEKVIIFSRYVDLVRKISRRFLVPEITHKTSKEERKIILEAFRKGEVKVICTGEVLDEGLDVPDASVGIIISGTGSTRQYMQRIGRILRKKNRKAKLIEIVTARSIDELLSMRRRGEIS